MTETDLKAVTVDGIDGVVPLTRAGRIYFAGQPTDAAIRALAEQEQVKVLVNFRHPMEMEVTGLDTAAVCQTNGVRYINIPFGGTFTSIEVDQLAEALNSTDENIILHCRTSNRVGAIWAAYLSTNKDVPIEDAIKAGRGAGMTMPEVEQFARSFISSQDGAADE